MGVGAEELAIEMRTYRAELHVHTVLSPCAEVEMIPPLIAYEAAQRGIELLAVTDHNASANIAAVQKAAAGYGLVVLPGMEVQTREEVHVLCLFDTLEQVAAWQAQVNAALPRLNNNADFFGEQFVVDETGDFIHSESRLLATSADLSIEQVFAAVTQLGGLAIPAHVNRQAYGLIANLGMVPPDLPVEALEISRHLKPEEALLRFPQLRGYPLIQSGDVHMLADFLGATFFEVESPTLAEIRLALKGAQGRKMSIHPG